MKDYISTDTGKTEAASGGHDDTGISMAICAEVLRTHWDRLNTRNVSWTEKLANFTPDNTKWF